MWEQQKQTSNSPFDCAVCGGCVYGSNSSIRTCLPCKSFFKRHAFLPSNILKCNQNGRCYIEATRRYFSSNLAPCRACRLQKCLAVGMDQNFFRLRSASSPPLTLADKFFNNILIKTSSLDGNVHSSNKQIASDNDQMMLGRIRCSSDASDRQRQF